MSAKLVTACCDGNAEMVERMMREDCDVACSADLALPDGTTPMMAAIIWGHTAVVKVLLDCGVNVNAQSECTNWTPLHAAALQENAELCQLLLERGADAGVEDAYGRRPVDYASIASAVWPHFEACGCERTSKEELVAKSIIKKVVETPPVDCPAEGGAAKHEAVQVEQPVPTKPEKGTMASNGSNGFSMTSVQSTVAEYSRPGSAYVKRDAAGGLPPPPPTRAGRPLAHGQATRRIREGPGRGVASSHGKGGSNEMAVIGRGQKTEPEPKNFNMMTIA